MEDPGQLMETGMAKDVDVATMRATIARQQEIIQHYRQRQELGEAIIKKLSAQRDQVRLEYRVLTNLLIGHWSYYFLSRKVKDWIFKDER